MKRLIIGDIHGCYAELQDLLDKAALSADDEIIALGDIVDRGPDSPRVLDFFQTRPNARSIQGNHERKHLRSFAGEIPPARSQQITRHQLGSAYPSAVAFIETFPTSLDLPEATLVHGFWEPGRSLAGQHPTVIVGTLSGERRLREHYPRPWYELYDGAKPLIVGHYDYLRNGQPLVYRDKVFALDTGCCHGGALTALMLPEFQIISVPSRADYWQALRQQYRRIPFAVEPPRVWDHESETLLVQFYAAIVDEHERVMAHLRRDPAFDALTPRLQGKAYAAYIGDTPLARYLHGARQGKLSLDRLRRDFRHPGRLRMFLQRAGMSFGRSI
jgi:serine/threonine protein phosphatase 1